MFREKREEYEYAYVCKCYEIYIYGWKYRKKCTKKLISTKIMLFSVYPKIEIYCFIKISTFL